MQKCSSNKIRMPIRTNELPHGKLRSQRSAHLPKVMAPTKSVSQLIVSGRLLLVVKNVKDRTTFGIFDLREDRLQFMQTMPRVRADHWSVSESLNLVACVADEDGMVSTFDATDGVVKNGFRVAPDIGITGILLYDETIRIREKSAIQAFDLYGKQLATYRIPSERSNDLGKYTISKNGDRYELQNGCGEHLSDFVVEGVGITSAALLSKGLVVAEGGGPITLFDEIGGIIWQKPSSDGHHPVAVAVGPDDEIYAIHAHLASLSRSIFTVQQQDGVVLAQQEIDFCPPVRAFSTSLRGWIIGGFQTFEYKDEKFTQRRLESLKSAFAIED